MYFESAYRINAIFVAIVMTGLLLVLPTPKGTASELSGGEAIHTHHRPNDEATDDGQRYSLFTHRTCGYLLLLIGILLGFDRATASGSRLLLYAIGTTWMVFALFIFVAADPGDGPMGRGLLESWNMPSWYPLFIQAEDRL